jgi:hypothetical protein
MMGPLLLYLLFISLPTAHEGTGRPLTGWIPEINREIKVHWDPTVNGFFPVLWSSLASWLLWGVCLGELAFLCLNYNLSGQLPNTLIPTTSGRETRDDIGPPVS